MTTATLAPETDILRAVNRGPAPMTVQWNGVEYQLLPDTDTFLPAAAAICWFGDPRAEKNVRSEKSPSGSVAFIPDRATEVRRLRIKYSADLTGDETTFDGIAIPNVELFTVNGDRVTTVLDDPRGDTVIAASTTIQSDAELRALVAQQQRDLEMMRQKLGIDTGTAEREDEIPADDGTPGLTPTKGFTAPPGEDMDLGAE